MFMHDVFEALDTRPLLCAGKSYVIRVYAAQMDSDCLWIQLGLSDDAGAVIPVVVRAARLADSGAVMSRLQQWLMAGDLQLDRVIVVD